MKQLSIKSRVAIETALEELVILYKSRLETASLRVLKESLTYEIETLETALNEFKDWNYGEVGDYSSQQVDKES